MSEPDVIVIGGGPAGMSAAIAAASKGLAVALCEQRMALGGAIYRQPAADIAAIPSLPSLKGRWDDLSARITASGVTVETRRLFAGVDSTGAVLIENRAEDRIEVRRPRALILACGALERIRPRPGWHMAGVVAAGGLQVMLKEGRVPQGRVLLAGNGPLLMALAAQMAAAGNPPVAIVEAGDPFLRPAAALRMATRPWLVPDMATLLAPILRGRMAWRRGTEVTAITRTDGVLTARLRDRHGREEQVEVDRIALHDGLRSNDFGLPAENLDRGMIVLCAGDAREILGALAAEADGTRAGLEAAERLSGRAAPAAPRMVERERTTQAALADLFTPVESAPALTDLPEDTVICRCEGRTLGDLKAQLAGIDAISVREVRLNGRFGMGACQGRFCADWTVKLMSALRPGETEPELADMIGRRWPLRPVSLSALARASCQSGDGKADALSGEVSA